MKLRQSLAFAIVVSACGGASPEQPTLVATVEAPGPRLTPCAEGWREVPGAHHVATCEPYAEAGYAEGCAFDEVHLPGTPGCARIGPTCPTDGWPADLPADRALLYVDDDAAPGGDGRTRATAMRQISDAVAAAATPGTVIAVAVGRYDEAISLSNGQTLWGACVSGTRIVTRASSERSETEAAVVISSDGAALRNVAIEGPERVGILVTGGSGVSVERVVVERARIVGLYPIGGSSVTARDLVVRGTRFTESTRAGGAGIAVERGARLVLSRALIDGNRTFGLQADGVGTQLDASDVVVRGTLAQESDDTLGRGVNVQAGAHLTLTRALVVGNTDAGLFAGSGGAPGTTLAATDVVVRGTHAEERSDFAGRGLLAQSRSHVTLVRVLVDGNREEGLVATDAGTVLEASDVVVRGTLSREADGLFGRGIEVQLGAHVTLARALVEQNRNAGLHVYGEGSVVDATDLWVRDTMPEISAGTFGVALWAQLGGTLRGSRVHLERSRFAGVVSTGSATVALRDLALDGVEPSACPESVCVGTMGGFGLVANSGGTLSVDAFTVGGASLCGLLVGADAASGESAITLGSGAITGAAVGVCVQAPGYDSALAQRHVTFTEVGAVTAQTDHELPISLESRM